MSRGAWLAVGSALALIGCGGAAEPSPGAAGDSGAGNPGPSPATFACAMSQCERATQFCTMKSGGLELGCEADDASAQFPTQCLATPTCDCVTQAMEPSACHCVDLEGGIGIECIGCYGAPPARLERLVGRA